MALDKTLPGSYISVADLEAAYTGIDFSTLQSGQAARAIKRASDWVNQICKITLYPTVDTVQLAQNVYPECYTVNQENGYLDLWPKFFPIQSIVSLSYQYGINLNGGTPVTVPLAYAQIFARWIRLQTDYLGVWGQGILWPAPLYVNLSYVNGYNIAQLASATLANTSPNMTLVPPPGSATIQASGAFTAGSLLEIQDSTNGSEIVVVSSVSGNVVTCTGNIQLAHAADVTVADPKLALAQQATINIATYLVKERGLGPVSLNNNSFEAQKARGGMDPDLIADAREMLIDFIANA